MSRKAIIVLAAGRGERLGGELPKAFVPLCGRTLIERSLRTAAEAICVDLVQPVLARVDFDRYAELDLGSVPKLAAPVPGGVERQDSVAAGVAALPTDIEVVGVHDAARCMVSVDEIERVMARAEQEGAALLATPARDTIKRVRDGRVVETPARAECWVAQTPQAFRVELLREALEKARADGILGTDDAQLVERLGVPVHIVEGSARNLKITLPEDLSTAASWLAASEAPQ
jgi:2-C-methyl-D-erythritol 4-phosphate cytidylyltransferase